MLGAFFTHGAGPCDATIGAAADPNGPTPEAEALGDGLVYLHGPADGGLTSLLLQFGFTRADAGHGVTLVLCGDDAQRLRPTIVPVRPCHRCGRPTKTGRDNETWRRVQIKYLVSCVELAHFACSLHVMTKGPSGSPQPPPSVLLVDGLEHFFGPENSTAVVFRTLALLFEARRYMAKATGYGEIVLSGASNAPLLQTRHALHRWCRFLRITRQRDGVLELTDEADEDGVHGDHDSSDHAPLLVLRYEYDPPGGREAEGGFRLLDVQQRRRSGAV